jgi:hypothetical protein
MSTDKTYNPFRAELQASSPVKTPHLGLSALQWAGAYAKAYDNMSLFGDKPDAGRARSVEEAWAPLFQAAFDRNPKKDFVPFMSITLTNKLNLQWLIARYSALPKKAGYYAKDAFLNSDWWKQFSLAQYGLTEANVLMGMVVGGEDNDYDEQGLYFTGKTFAEQQEAVRGWLAERPNGRSLDVANTIGINASLRELGLQLLDTKTVQRFAQMPLGSDGFAPGAYVYEFDGQFRVGRCDVGAYDNYGVRFAEGI